METIPGLREAEALVEVLKEFPEIKAWLSFSCKVTDIKLLHKLSWNYKYRTYIMICNDKLQHIYVIKTSKSVLDIAIKGTIWHKSSSFY